MFEAVATTPPTKRRRLEWTMEYVRGWRESDLSSPVIIHNLSINTIIYASLFFRTKSQLAKSAYIVEKLFLYETKWKLGAFSPPRLPDIRSICVISASYYPFIGLWWAHMKFQSKIYGFWKIEKITFFQGSPLWKLFGTSKNANFQCIYKICCSFVILWDTDIPNMSN